MGISKAARDLSKDLPKLLILGSGWGSYSLLNHISKTAYRSQSPSSLWMVLVMMVVGRVVVLSPRNHFLFTPLLASTTVGTIEFRCGAPCAGLK